MLVRSGRRLSRLTSNLAVDQRFANGTQGRIMYWHPKKTENRRLALAASHSDMMARFLKVTSMQKAELFPDVDHIDVQVRPETLRSRGEPALLQLPLVPCYALTIHKTQALSIKHIVRGCLEGIFAFGQLYVLVSFQGLELAEISRFDFASLCKTAGMSGGRVVVRTLVISSWLVCRRRIYSRHLRPLCAGPALILTALSTSASECRRSGSTIL